MQERKRVSTRVHTREIDRHVARKQMQQIGMRKVCKHNYYGAAYERVYNNSYFANHWREFCVGGTKEKEDN